MDEKREKCKRCGGKMNPKTKRAEFCSPKCKVYWHREVSKKIEYTPTMHPTSKSNIEKFNAAFKREFDTIIKENSNIPPMPVREKGEDAFDFAARKSEWKKKYNQ